MAVKICGVESGSLAEKAKIKVGDALLSINNHPINDVLDYQFYATDQKLKLKLDSGVKRIRKGADEDIGLVFSSFLMDEKRHCKNNCIFCFISQMPEGMRDTLYFKDDDARLSFLQGNYITLTNLSDSEVERIINMRLCINVSIHTTDKELRQKMLGNRFAGDALDTFDKIAKAGNSINCQCVLCPGINDGEALERTLTDLSNYPSVQSIACVPVGLTKFREGLPHLEQFTKEGAGRVIDIIDRFGDIMTERYGERIVYPADEFFIIAEREFPPYEYYGDFAQYENGVGMWVSLEKEFLDAARTELSHTDLPHKTVATGALAAPLIRRLAHSVNPNIDVIAITNDFFGDTITVAGLVTATDIIAQLKGKDIDELLIPRAMLRAEDDVFLDDLTIDDVEKALGVRITVVGNSGYDLLNAILI